jgi:hypothetical protein
MPFSVIILIYKKVSPIRTLIILQSKNSFEENLLEIDSQRKFQSQSEYMTYNNEFDIKMKKLISI